MTYGTKRQYRELIQECEEDLAYWEYVIVRSWEIDWKQGKIDLCRRCLAELKDDFTHAR
jgi:hypothetical protein